ncbi:MAG: hypothetical protein LBS25_10525, partial [Candidatus Symbiothrix sp.]|nr:hypothetical protein [Candidatus Symbiothrix sp.]
MRKINFFFKWTTILAIVLNVTFAFGATEISDRAGLEALSNVTSGDYVLTADIDLGGSNWTPIGGDNAGFTLNGQGHVIKNMKVDVTSGQSGLFKKLTGATIRNLGFDNCYVKSNQGGVGIVAGEICNTTIENVYVIHSHIQSTGDHTGGLIGRVYNGSTVRNSYANTHVYGEADQTGGLIGCIKAAGWTGGPGSGNSVTIANCYFGGLLLSNNRANAIAAIADDGTYTISNCVNLAPALLLRSNGKADANRQCRIITPEKLSGTQLSNNYSLETTVYGNSLTVASTSDTNYGADKALGANVSEAAAKTQSFYETTLGWDFSGGTWKFITGYDYPVLGIQTAAPVITIADASELVSKLTTYQAGHFVLTNDIELTGDWTPIHSGSNPFRGTLDGNGHIIKGVYYNASGNGEKGFFGETSVALIKNVGFENAHIVGNANIGGIVGWAKATVITKSYVANSYIEGRDHTGSIAGTIEYGTLIDNCYSNAYLYSREHQGGGLVGIFKNENSVIQKSYFSGVVRCPDRPAGIVALDDENDNSRKKIVRYNLNLASYLVGSSIVRIGETANRSMTLTENYSISATLVKAGDASKLEGSPVPTTDTNYGANKKHGANIPNGDANAKAAGQTDFYETVLAWDFTDTWKFGTDGYPILKWQATPANLGFLTLTAARTVQSNNTLSLKQNETLDLSTTLLLNNPMAVTYASTSDKVEISGSSLSIKANVTIVSPENISITVTPTASDFACEQIFTVMLMPDEPIMISTPNDLFLLNAAPTLQFELANDIDFTGLTFTPIESFSGTLNGAGHVI